MEEVEQRIRDEEPVLLIGYPMCRAFNTLIELTQAGKPSEFELKNLVEHCVTHLKFCFRMYDTQRNAGRLFLHEHPWDAWSRGLSFVKDMAEMDGVHKTNGNLGRFQLATNSIEKGSWFMWNSECKNHMKNCVIAVQRSMKREIDSAKAIGSMEVGITCEEPNVLELDEHAEEPQTVFDNISEVRLDPEFLNASRNVEIHFMNRLEVYRKRPRSWATGKGLHVSEVGGHRSRCCVKKLKRWDPTMPGTYASMGPFECVMFMFSKALMWKTGASCATALKILFLDASNAHCQAEATSEMAIELPPEEQVKGEDFIGELQKSLYGTRKVTHNWKKKWQRVIIDSGFVIGTWSPAIVYCRERELCGSLHGDDFIITGDSMQLAWIESQLCEGLILKRRAIQGPDDGDDKIDTILNRLVTWVFLSGSRNRH